MGMNEFRGGAIGSTKEGAPMNLLLEPITPSDFGGAKCLD